MPLTGNVMDLHQKSMNQESFSVTLGDFFVPGNKEGDGT